MCLWFLLEQLKHLEYPRSFYGIGQENSQREQRKYENTGVQGRADPARVSPITAHRLQPFKGSPESPCSQFLQPSRGPGALETKEMVWSTPAQGRQCLRWAQGGSHWDREKTLGVRAAERALQVSRPWCQLHGAQASSRPPDFTRSVLPHLL